MTQEEFHARALELLEQIAENTRADAEESRQLCEEMRQLRAALEALPEQIGAAIKAARTDPAQLQAQREEFLQAFSKAAERAALNVHRLAAQKQAEALTAAVALRSYEEQGGRVFGG